MLEHLQHTTQFAALTRCLRTAFRDVLSEARLATVVSWCGSPWRRAALRSRPDPASTDWSAASGRGVSNDRPATSSRNQLLSQNCVPFNR